MLFGQPACRSMQYFDCFPVGRLNIAKSWAHGDSEMHPLLQLGLILNRLPCICPVPGPHPPPAPETGWVLNYSRSGALLTSYTSSRNKNKLLQLPIYSMSISSLALRDRARHAASPAPPLPRPCHNGTATARPRRPTLPTPVAVTSYRPALQHHTPAPLPERVYAPSRRSAGSRTG